MRGSTIIGLLLIPSVLGAREVCEAEPRDYIHLLQRTYQHSRMNHPSPATYTYYGVKDGTPGNPITLKTYQNHEVKAEEEINNDRNIDVFNLVSVSRNQGADHR